MERHSHLNRLERVWTDEETYFLTLATSRRAPVLDNPAFHQISIDEFRALEDKRGWLVGRYVIMPDHVHFFVSRKHQQAEALSMAIGKWKEWTAKRFLDVSRMSAPLWQREFFDHLLRNDESHAEKWEYVRSNPVRAGLVDTAEDWPYQGEFHHL